MYLVTFFDAFKSDQIFLLIKLMRQIFYPKTHNRNNF